MTTKTAAVTSTTTNTLLDAARARRATVPHTTPSRLHDALIAELEGSGRTTLFARDGLLPDPAGLVWYGLGRGSPSWGEALQQWGVQRRAAQAHDTVVDWRTLRLDPRDGALWRLGGKGNALPLTQHALGQLVGVLRSEGSARGLAGLLEWLSPGGRAEVLAEVMAASRRGPRDPLVVRTACMPASRVGVPTLTREVRAIVTPRHAGAHFDDGVLAGRLAVLASAESAGAVYRAPHATETRGWVELDRTGEGLRRVVSFRNSETGQARLGFWGSARIVAVDGLMVSPGAALVEVGVLDAGDKHERNHTLPTVGTPQLHEMYGVPSSGKLTEEHRRSIAEQRIDASYRAATERATALRVAWTEALVAYPAGLSPSAHASESPEARADVLLDLLLGEGLLLDTTREALRAVLVDEKRLSNLPWGSAAYLAAAYAVLAQRGTVDEKTGQRLHVAWSDAHQLQVVAGRWVLARWNLREHRRLAGVE